LRARAHHDEHCIARALCMRGNMPRGSLRRSIAVRARSRRIDPSNRRLPMVCQIVRNTFAVAVSLLVLLVGTAFADKVRHDTKFHAVPDSKLEIRAVSYDGSVNGKLTVEVRNKGKSAEKFSAQGLYFVPEGNPDTAPQRLGAVGPMQMAADA